MTNQERWSSKRLLVGNDSATNVPQYVPMKDLLSTSMHVLGASGYGKSYFLRQVALGLINERMPFAIIDPHGELCDFALERLRRAGVSPSRIVILDPSDDRYSVGFNPLFCGVSDPGEASSLVLEAFMKAWGVRGFDDAPRMEGILRGTFRLLIESRLSLNETFDVLAVDNVSLRTALREHVSDRLVRQDFEELDKWTRGDRLSILESARNRCRRLLHADAVRRMFSQTRNTLNFRTVLDEGKYLLVNLGRTPAPETQRLVGALVINGIFHSAKRRDTRRRRDYFLMVDEFGEFATRDFAASLDQLRKFGVHLCLAHQRLDQLERTDRDVLSAVMTNAKVKAVFGGLSRQDAETMARELYTGHVNGDEVKHVTTATKFRPIEDTFEVETFSSSDSDGESSSESAATSTSESESGSMTRGFEGEHTFGEPVEPDRLNYAATRGRGSSFATSSAAGRAQSRTRTSGYSRSITPITRHEEFTEVTGTTFRSLDEVWERQVAHLHGLRQREAVVRVLNGTPYTIVTPHVDAERRDRRFRNYSVRIMERCPQVLPAHEISALMDARRVEVAQLVEKSEDKRVPNPRSFRE